MLYIKNISVSVGSKKILDDFSLNVNSGEIHAIMGPNGTGKSTLSKVIMGSNEYKVISGEIIFENQRINLLDVDQRAKLGIFYVMQSPVSIDGITNSEFIKCAINERRDEPIGLFDFIKSVEKTCNDLEMDKEVLHRNINVGASGGERKKNEIFQMKLLKPKFIIFDELDSGLDVDSLKVVCKNINQYLDENPDTSILIITHYPKILEYLKPNYVHIMKDGKIVKTGDYNLALKIEKYGYNELNILSENDNCE